MAGHNKWSKIKRKKGANDAKRGKIFTKLIRELTVASKEGGPDPDHNPRLRLAINSARAQDMPNDNIDRAIKRGSGKDESVDYLEISYEGYGPAGTAVIVQCMTDNKQRTVAEVRHAFSKYGGNLGENGSVSWNFESKGLFLTQPRTESEEELMEWAIEAGADDLKAAEDGQFELTTDPKSVHDVRSNLEAKGLTFETVEIVKIPKTTTNLNEQEAATMLKLVDALEDNDDVQSVFHNAEIEDAIMEKLQND